MRKKAAEELKREQERKAEERRWIIDDRCGEPEDLEWSCKGMQNLLGISLCTQVTGSVLTIKFQVLIKPDEV